MVVVYNKFQRGYVGGGINKLNLLKKVTCVPTGKVLTLTNRNFLQSIGLKLRK